MYFVVADVSRLKPLEASVRKMAAQDPRSKRIAGLALMGATFHMRVLIAMMAKAMSIFHGRPHGKFNAFDTEQEAFAWIAKERESMRSR